MLVAVGSSRQSCLHASQPQPHKGDISWLSGDSLMWFQSQSKHQSSINNILAGARPSQASGIQLIRLIQQPTVTSRLPIRAGTLPRWSCPVRSRHAQTSSPTRQVGQRGVEELRLPMEVSSTKSKSYQIEGEGGLGRGVGSAMDRRRHAACFPGIYALTLVL